MTDDDSLQVENPRSGNAVDTIGQGVLFGVQHAGAQSRYLGAWLWSMFALVHNVMLYRRGCI